MLGWLPLFLQEKKTTVEIKAKEICLQKKSNSQSNLKAEGWHKQVPFIISSLATSSSV